MAHPWGGIISRRGLCAGLLCRVISLLVKALVFCVLVLGDVQPEFLAALGHRRRANLFRQPMSSAFRHRSAADTGFVVSDAFRFHSSSDYRTLHRNRSFREHVRTPGPRLRLTCPSPTVGWQCCANGPVYDCVFRVSGSPSLFPRPPSPRRHPLSSRLLPHLASAQHGRLTPPASVRHRTSPFTVTMRIRGLLLFIAAGAAAVIVSQAHEE